MSLQEEQDKAIQALENLLNRETVYKNIIFSSVFVMFFETLKHFIIWKLKELYCEKRIGSRNCNNDDFDDFKETERYKQEVKFLEGNLLYASTRWFQNHGAINQKEYDTVLEAYTRRCRFVHELFNCLSENISEHDVTLLCAIAEIYYKLDSWWIYNIDFPDEVPNPETVKQEDCLSSTALFHKMIIDIITGNDNKYTEILEQIRSAIKQQRMP